jgi:DNA-binding GntR family transcriptional regulator
MEIIAMIRRRDPVKLEQLIRQHYIDTGHKIVEQEN